MKSTKTTSFVLLFGIALFITCSPDPDPILTPGAQAMQVQAEVTSNFINPFVGESFQICGSSLNCNLVSTSPSIKLSGVISKVMDTGEFEVSDGELYLCVQSLGCNLVGHYEGKGIEDDYGVRLSGLVYVDHGVGVFKADGGQLQLSMIGERIENNKEEMNFNISVIGYISNRSNNFIN